MGNAIPAVKANRTLVVGYDPAIAAGKIHSKIRETMTNLLSINDGTGRNGAMRIAILDLMNGLNRYTRDQFIMSGVTEQADYARHDNQERT